MIKTPEAKKIYSSIQKQLFYLIPEKWESIYLYASVMEQMFNLETGELFFYYYPKGLLKKNPINVYEIPNRFSLNEEEYIKLIEKLYQTIKELRQEYKRSGERVWSNITIKLVGLKFEIEFHFDELSDSKYSNTERHIIWKYKYLDIPIESFSKKDRKLIQEYLEENEIENEDIDIYSESIYKRPIKNVIDYNKQQSAPVEKFVTEKDLLEMEAKKRFEEQRYTFIRKEKRALRSKNKEESKKELTYQEQVDAQRNAVKSQILNHL